MCNKDALLIITCLFFLIGIIACGSNAENKVQEKRTEITQNQSEINTNFLISIDSCTSISILKSDGEKAVFNQDDSYTILSYLNSAIYDKERNDSGIKFKMTNPDYTLLIESETENKIVQLWISKPLLLFEAKWYIIPSQININPVLEKYSKVTIE